MPPKDLLPDLGLFPSTGLVNKPRTFDLDELLKFPLEERVYRLRCVEGWSMVIPWIGFPLHKLLEKVEPTSDARFVAFQTLLDPRQNAESTDWRTWNGRMWKDSDWTRRCIR